MDCSNSKVKMSSPDSETQTDSVVTNSNLVPSNIFEDIHFNPSQISASTSAWESSEFAELHRTAKVYEQAWPQTALKGICKNTLKGNVAMRLASIGCIHSGGPTKFRKQHRNFVYGSTCRRMFIAAMTNDTDRMEDILNKGHSPNVLDNCGRTSLHIAAGRGYTDMVKILLSHGADPNAFNRKGQTPLHLAIASAQNVAVVTLLLEAGSSILAKDKSNSNALQLAHNRLKIYSNYTAEESHKAEQEINTIIEILVLFLKKQGAHNEEMLALSSEIRQLDTSDHLQDDVKSLLAKLDTLNIEG